MLVWDDAKEKANIAKHGLSFSLAYDFDFDTAAEFDRSREDDGESRYALVGYLHGRLHTMIYTPRGNRIRVISLRRANRNEERAYEKIIKENEAGG